jgi:hypothetical protein
MSCKNYLLIFLYCVVLSVSVLSDTDLWTENCAKVVTG